MLRIVVYFTGFFFLFKASCATYDFPTPVLHECPFASNLVDFCISKFKLCIDRKSGYSYCSKLFCDCSKINLRENEEKCRDNITDTCRLLKTRSSTDRVNLSSFKWPDEMKSLFNEWRELCGVGTDEDEGLSIADVVKTISTNECARKLEEKLDQYLMKLSIQTTTDLTIPLDRFRCGWHYGDFGKVLSQYWIKEACGDYTVNFNFCCAEHMNCYMNQGGKQDCDEQFTSCRKKVVLLMVAYRESCQLLISESSHELFVPSVEVHQSFGNIKITTQISSFEGKIVHSSFSSTNLNFSEIKVFELSTSSWLDHDIRDMFNEEIYKNGWSNRVTIDSCGLNFEYFRKHNKMSLALKQLVFCIHKIENKEEELERTLHKFNQTISSRFVSPLSKTEVEEMISSEVSLIQWFFVVELAFRLIWLLWKAWKSRAWLQEICRNWCRPCNTNPQRVPDQPESIEMLEQPEGIQEESNGQMVGRSNGSSDVHT